MIYWMLHFQYYCRNCPIVLLVLLTSCLHHRQPPPPPPQAVTTIQLLPYTGFDVTLISAIRDTIAHFYNCTVQVLPAVPLPVNAWYTPRRRYKADSLLMFQQAITLPNTIIAGFSYADISTQKDSHIDDWGVFGLGYCPGRACVVSSWRLQKASRSRLQLEERLCKVVLHELGHNFGLPHCTASPVCLMADAGGTLAQVDREQQQLCTACKRHLQSRL